MKQYILWGKGGTLSTICRDMSNSIIPADSTPTATYYVYQSDEAETSDTAKITGAASYGWTTTLTAVHIATSGNTLKLTSTAGIKDGDMIFLKSKDNGYSEYARVWRVTETANTIRITEKTQYDYSTADYIFNPVLKVGITSTQAQSASLLGLEQNHRIQFDYSVAGTKVYDTLYFDVVNRYPRPPITPLDVMEKGRPEIRDEMPNQKLIGDFIVRAWEEMLGNIIVDGGEPQYLQNEELLFYPMVYFVLAKICRDVSMKRDDDLFDALHTEYREEYINSYNSIRPRLRFATDEGLEERASDSQFGLVSFERGGIGGLLE